MNRISSPCIATLSLEIKDSQGEVLLPFEEPSEVLVNNTFLLPKVEAALQKKSAGDTVELYLEPADAFGEYDEKLIFLEERDLFPQDLEEGMLFDTLPEGAKAKEKEGSTFFFVSEIYPDHIILDGNHPLAGMSIAVTVRVHAVRKASEDDLRNAQDGSVLGNFMVLDERTADSDSDSESTHTLL